MRAGVLEPLPAGVPPLPHLPDRIGLAYRPEAPLSSGEGRSAWLVRRRADGAPFVLKQSLWGGEDLMEEFRLLVQVHPLLAGAAPAPVDCFEEDGTWYLLRTCLPGRTLAQYQEQEASPGLDETFCRHAGLQLCALLERLHGLDPPVIHRDIKPENIILGPDGRLGLIDFGIARRYEPDKSGDTRLMGTEGTAAPEQYGFAQTDERTDLYALGMTLTRLLTGGYDRTALDRAEVSPRLREVLLKCTAFAPEDRYQSAEDLSAALDGRPRRRMGRGLRRLAGAAALCALLAAGAAGYVRWWLPTRPVSFPSAGLEAAVRAELERPQGEILRRDLENVRRLAVLGHETFSPDQVYRCTLHSYLDDEPLENCPPGDVSDLSLLARMPNLTELYLCHQQISDLTPLAGLPLTTLALTGNQVEDVSPLASLDALETLYLGDNPVADYAPLSGLSRLRYLNLDGAYRGRATAVTASLDFLRGMRLESLSVCGIEPEDGDWSPLAELSRLVELTTWHLPAPAVPTIAQNRHMTYLALFRCQLEDLTPLAGAAGLTGLGINEASLSLEGIQALTGLEEVNITACSRLDLSPLAGLDRLGFVNLSGTPVADYAPLLELDGLTEVRVLEEDIPALEAQCPGRAFTVNLGEA